MTQRVDLNQSPHAEQPKQPPIYVRTLGVFEVLVHGIQAAWKSRNAGAKQLQRGFGYLVLRRDRPVRRDELIRVAGGREPVYGDRRHVISGLLKLIKTWGLDVAAKKQRSTITLHQHPIWGSDTDQLNALFTAAQALEESGQLKRAFDLLEPAEDLCGGDYLPIFARGFDPALDSANAHWQNVQKQSLRLLARLAMALPGEEHRLQAARFAGVAIQFDRANPDSYRFAARAARHSGNEDIARYYEEIAQNLTQQTPPKP